MEKFDVIIIGSGAAGLMCAIEAGKRKRKVLVLDHANKPGKKILMSGGGRCNFTNYNIDFANYLSHNPYFLKSALSRYTQWNFLELVKKHHVTFYEKKHGQLFCNNSSKDILNMLLTECKQANVKIKLQTSVLSVTNVQINSVQNNNTQNVNAQSNKAQNNSIQHSEENFLIKYRCEQNQGTYTCESLVIASGGLSIPTMGASPFGYKIAEQFGIKIWPTRAGLVAFTLQPQDKEKLSPLAGISALCKITTASKSFGDDVLFTHRGLSGPAVLQISSYWQAGHPITIDFLPSIDLLARLQAAKQHKPNTLVKNFLATLLAKRLVTTLLAHYTPASAKLNIAEQPLQHLSKTLIAAICQTFKAWQLIPNATEGYRTAEVTLGGVDCNAISSQSMETKAVPRLYFIGEVLDVTGWLGGFNLQWAWSSGWAAGQYC